QAGLVHASVRKLARDLIEGHATVFGNPGGSMIRAENRERGLSDMPVVHQDSPLALAKVEALTHVAFFAGAIGQARAGLGRVWRGGADQGQASGNGSFQDAVRGEMS